MKVLLQRGNVIRGNEVATKGERMGTGKTLTLLGEHFEALGEPYTCQPPSSG